MADSERLVSALLDGDHAALAKVITRIENRQPGYRRLVSALHEHTGSADLIGITGSPGAGKSTLVDKLAKRYRDRGDEVGVIAVDPSSPFTGGAVLGDRIRMASTAGDMDVFFRSMSTRGNLGGLSTATADAVKALDAFGKDVILVETVGAGQNEVDIVKTADTVAVLVPPASGDDIQMLKAGILEIGDVFVVNKADLQGADKTVQELRSMLEMRDRTGEGWEPQILETVATSGEGVEELLDTLENHVAWLAESGTGVEHEKRRYAEEIRRLLRDDAAGLAGQPYLNRLGPEVLDPATTVETVAARLADPAFRRRQLGALLTDQGFLAGLGNYLRCEVLHVAGLHPARRPMDLDAATLDALARACLALPRQSYETGGVTNDPERAEALRQAGHPFEAYRFRVYRRAGAPCYRCGTSIEKRRLNSQPTYLCPACQPTTVSSPKSQVPSS